MFVYLFVYLFVYMFVYLFVYSVNIYSVNIYSVALSVNKSIHSLKCPAHHHCHFFKNFALRCTDDVEQSLS